MEDQILAAIRGRLQAPADDRRSGGHLILVSPALGAGTNS